MKKSLKVTVALMFVAISGLLFAFTTKATDSGKSDKTEVSSLVPKTIIFGTRSRPSCEGECCDGTRGICLIIKNQVMRPGSPNENLDGKKNMGVGELRSVNERQVELNIIKDTAPAETGGDRFHVEEDVDVNPAIARSLGYSELTIKKGIYRMDFSKSQFGTVLLDVVGTK